MLSAKNIVITGCTGFIAPHLFNKILSEDCNFLLLSRRAIDNDIFKSSHNNFSNILVDLNDAQKVIEIISAFNPHVIFHLASKPDAPENYQHVTETIDNNIKCTVSLLEAFSRCDNAESFVYGDSVKVYGNVGKHYNHASPIIPNSSYAIAKLAAWHFCKLYGSLHQFNSISVRPTLIFGPGQPVNIFDFVIKSILKGQKEITLMGGDQTRSPLYINDAVNAYIKAVDCAEEANGKVFNIGGKDELKVIDLVQMIIDLMDADVIVHKSQENIRDTEIATSMVDLDETLMCFDWKPEYDFSHAIQETIDSYMTLSAVN